MEYRNSIIIIISMWLFGYNHFFEKFQVLVIIIEWMHWYSLEPNSRLLFSFFFALREIKSLNCFRDYITSVVRKAKANPLYGFVEFGTVEPISHGSMGYWVLGYGYGFGPWTLDWTTQTVPFQFLKLIKIRCQIQFIQTTFLMKFSNVNGFKIQQNDENELSNWISNYD